MEKSKSYRARFTPEVLKEAVDCLWTSAEQSGDSGLTSHPTSVECREVETNGETWSHDNDEEFFADYRSSCGRAFYDRIKGSIRLNLAMHDSHTSVTVRAEHRTTIQKTFSVFEKHLAQCLIPLPPAPVLPPPPKPKIFIGHGRSPQWKDLKDHLHDIHGYQVIAYETGARSGHVIRDILVTMLEESNFALLVMTAEDEAADGTMRARQNVVHEAGLFQGRLGFDRAIIVADADTSMFSNVDGIQRILFANGNIRESFGDVLGTIKREFGR